jgi:hypothetical protein
MIAAKGRDHLIALDRTHKHFSSAGYRMCDRGYRIIVFLG